MIKDLIESVAGPVINKLVGLIPDPQERERARAQAMKDMLDAALAQDAAQIEVNKIEAAHSSVFVAGWRPFIGWCCGAGVLWAFFIGPLANWLVTVTGATIQPPAIVTDHLFEMVFALLGMGGLRTFEKLKGIAR